MASRAVSLKPEPGAVTDREGQLASRDNLALGIGLLFLLAYPALDTLLGRTRLGAMEGIMVYVILAMGLNIVVGYAGLLDLGYAAFFAIGAYTMGFLTSPASYFVKQGWIPELFTSKWGFWPALAVSWVVAAIFGVLLGTPTLRLRGDYLAIVTLGFGEIVPVFFRNMADITFNFQIGPITIVADHLNLTGGPLGINPIDAPFLPFLNIRFNASAGFAPVYLGMFLLVVAILVARNLERSRIGRAWMAIREDELAAEMMGVNTLRTKLLAFALGASFAGVAGSLQASYLGATTSDFFQFSTSILVAIMIIVGGVGNIWGVLLGAVALVYVDKTFLPYLGQQFQTIAPSFPNPAQFNFLFFGVTLVLMMRFRPEGFLPNRQRAAELTVHGLVEASKARGEEIGLDNLDIAPPGQDEVAEDAREAETIEEAREE